MAAGADGPRPPFSVTLGSARLHFALALMVVRYAKSYIDQLYEAEDLLALDGVIDVVGRDRPLPDQFWLSRRLFAWCGWGRSGIWQYYEAIPLDDLPIEDYNLTRV